MTASRNSQAHIAPTAGGVPSSPSLALYPASPASSLANAGAAVTPPAAAPVQFYDGFVEPKSEVWRLP